MIEFGSFLSMCILLVFLVVQGVLLYNDRNWQSILAVALFGVGSYFIIDDWPTFNYRFLIIYPFLAALWLPIYWYSDLSRRASEIKAGVLRYGSIKSYYDSSNPSKDISYDVKSGEYVVNLKHPSKDDLFANSIAFPISIPLFLGENAIKMFIDYITHWMDNVRIKFNKSVQDFSKNHLSN